MRSEGLTVFYPRVVVRMKSVIEPMQERDLDELIPIFQIANPTEHETRIREYTSNAMKRFPQLCFVCRTVESKKVIGGITCSILKKGAKGYVLDIAVSPAFQKQGHGRALLETAIEKFKEIDISQITLGVHYLNANVIPFYYKFGFRIHQARKNEFGDFQDAIIMMLTITDSTLPKKQI
jgi:ribosomal protein S18 acetylase RimI-like enzyme